jgi:hypothetical protein
LALSLGLAFFLIIKGFRTTSPDRNEAMPDTGAGALAAA